MYPRKPYSISLPGGRRLELGERTIVMGILNITPDSFADGGRYLEPGRAVSAGLAMVADGADILDIGGESTRPGADPVGAEEEMRRVLPVIEQLRSQTTAFISIDTYKSTVAREALQSGATIVNDISGLRYDPDLAAVVAEAGAAVVLMHTRGRSREMYEHAVYADVAAEVTQELEVAIDSATSSGVDREAIIVDPGFGFAKRAKQSYAVLAHLHRLAKLDRPILSGPSRKSFLKQAIGDRAPDEREWATAAAVTASVLLGAHIIRVHGVRAMADVARVADQLRESTPDGS
jgi:dihydropteroate synthase